MKKTAVLMYGYMRTWKATAGSAIEKILKPNNADLFIYTFDNEGISALPLGTSDINTFKRKNADAQDKEGGLITEKALKQTYGKYLKSFTIAKYNEQRFIDDTKNIPTVCCPVNRIFSLYNNITECAKLLVKYAKKNKIKYDAVILIRPDLYFYSKVDVSKLDLNNLTIPSVGGNLKLDGKNDIYFSAGYKNVKRGEYIPVDTVPFSDQFVISSFDNMKTLATLYDSLQLYYSEDFPVYHAESTLYYHLGVKQNLNVDVKPLMYEILRTNYIETDNSFILKLKRNTVAVDTSKGDKYKQKSKEDLHKIKDGLKACLKIPFHWIKWKYYKNFKKKK